MGLNECIHEVLSGTSIEIIITNNGKDETERMWDINTKAKGYKANMIRSKSKAMYKEFLDSFYPIEIYPEKHI